MSNSWNPWQEDLTIRGMLGVGFPFQFNPCDFAGTLYDDPRLSSAFVLLQGRTLPWTHDNSLQAVIGFVQVFLPTFPRSFVKRRHVSPLLGNRFNCPIKRILKYRRNIGLPFFKWIESTECRKRSIRLPGFLFQELIEGLIGNTS